MLGVRRATLDDADSIMKLNTEFVAVTSPMNEEQFHHLYKQCDLCIVAEIDGEIVGFVLALCKGAAYGNGNYQWFSERLNQFIYVDRVVVSNSGRGHGVGKALYTYAEEWAKEKQLFTMTAEMDIIPPNEYSLMFHKKQGFSELGLRELESGKIVSMQIKGL